MEHKKKVTGYIYTYSRKARDVVTGVAKKFLANSGISGISGHLFSCVDEIVKNAVKANYKFILIYDEISKNIAREYPDKTEEDLRQEMSDLLKVHESFNHMAIEVLKTRDISSGVREILNEEAKLLSIKDKAYLERRDLSTDELRKIHNFSKVNYIRQRIKENDIKIILKIQSDRDYIYIEVTNTAPILTKDLNRIYHKREEYKKYREEGKECEFFVNNLDTSESGFGLGYATIDSILNHWGLDPERAITIITSIDTTVMLTIPIEELKRSLHQ